MFNWCSDKVDPSKAHWDWWKKDKYYFISIGILIANIVKEKNRRRTWRCEHSRCRIGRYLLGSREKRLILKPRKKKCLENFVDADFCGNWNRMRASEDAITAKSRTGFIIMYAGCPIAWWSKLQKKVALSTAQPFIAWSNSDDPVIGWIKRKRFRNLLFRTHHPLQVLWRKWHFP